MGHKARIHASMRTTLKMKRCRYCHSRVNLTIDHKVPKIKGGKDELKNLQCLCKRCNGIKSQMTDKEVKSLFRWHTQILIDKENNKLIH